MYIVGDAFSRAGL